MDKILITGATGNVGVEVLKALTNMSLAIEVIAGVRNVVTDCNKLTKYTKHVVHFDFEDTNTYPAALQNIDVVFLLRPPQIADVQKYFKPLIEGCKQANIRHIIFLSVQGVEHNSIIPHHKIEQLIKESGIAFTFLRPAYFMQNFTTTLKKDLVESNLIFLPSGKAKFTLIDVADVGITVAHILKNLPDHINHSYDLTSDEALSFGEMAEILSKHLERNINYVSPNLFQFFKRKRKEHVSVMLILVMIMLHYFPRFLKQPPISNSVLDITNQSPKSFEQFVVEQKAILSIGA